jgi:hypothetical protein
MNYSNIKRNFLLMQCYEHILSGSHMTHPPTSRKRRWQSSHDGDRFHVAGHLDMEQSSYNVYLKMHECNLNYYH